jgi:hypothetical protein
MRSKSFWADKSIHNLVYFLHFCQSNSTLFAWLVNSLVIFTPGNTIIPFHKHSKLWLYNIFSVLDFRIFHDSTSLNLTVVNNNNCTARSDSTILTMCSCDIPVISPTTVMTATQKSTILCFQSHEIPIPYHCSHPQYIYRSVRGNNPAEKCT